MSILTGDMAFVRAWVNGDALNTQGDEFFRKFHDIRRIVPAGIAQQGNFIQVHTEFGHALSSKNSVGGIEARQFSPKRRRWAINFVLADRRTAGKPYISSPASSAATTSVSLRAASVQRCTAG